jgi:hypothetical protein
VSIFAAVFAPSRRANAIVAVGGGEPVEQVLTLGIPLAIFRSFRQARPPPSLRSRCRSTAEASVSALEGVRCQLLDHLLDQEIAERHAAQAIS